MTSCSQLSQNDTVVFHALFNPEVSLGSTPQAAVKTVTGKESDDVLNHSIQQAELDVLRSINTETPSTSDLQSAIVRLDALIEAHPEYASAYNNRAQARRTLSEIEHGPNDGTDEMLVLKDLTRAIELASPTHSHSFVSSEKARVLASAYTHRAFLLYRASLSRKQGHSSTAASELLNKNREMLEEMASKNFSAGGQYGNEIAKQLAVQTNPYAKLCGSIVKEALRKEMKEYVCKNELKML